MTDHQPHHAPAPAPVSAPAPVPDDRIHGDSLDGPSPAPPSVRGSWMVAGLGATLLLSSIAGLLSWDSLTGGLWRNVDQRQTYEQPVGALTLKGGASDIEVRGGGAPGTVEVARHLGWGPGSDMPTPREEWSGSTLNLDADCGGLLGWCSVDYVVTVPGTTEVTVDNGSGDVILSGALGAVTLTTGSGDVESSGLQATSVTGKVGSGDIDLDLASAPVSIDLRTGSGDVTVRVPQRSTYFVSTDSGSGSTDVTIATDPGDPDRMSLRTGSGDIDVSYR